MSLESATYISQLSTSDPPGGDPRSQGDDHLRLIKQVLQNTFPTASKAWYNPSSAAKSANYSVVAADMNKVFVLTTSGGAITMTLPSLAAGDAGWECSFIKIGTDTNPYFIAPPSGTIQSGEYSGLAKTRRCIPGKRTRVFWTGTAWIAERVTDTPIGTVLDCFQTATPVGWELASGATLSSASTNYPDYYSAMGSSGVLPDMNGRVGVGLDTGAAGRVTTAGSNIDSTTQNAAGGLQTTTIAQADLPNVTLGAGTLVVAAGQGSHTHDVKYTTFAVTAGGVPVVGSISSGGSSTGTSAAVASTLPQMTVSGSTASINGGVAQTAMRNMPPCIVTRKIVVVE